MTAPVTAWVGLGTNLGKRLANLEQALDRLDGREGIRVTRISRVYETPPWGVTDQPDFLNLCARLETDLPPRALLGELLAVERELHRVRTVRWGPRTIDLDLLLYGERTIREQGLTVPHPRMAERAFVLVPLAEIAPDAVVPPTGKTVAELAAGLEEADDVRPSPHRLQRGGSRQGTATR